MARITTKKVEVKKEATKGGGMRMKKDEVPALVDNPLPSPITNIRELVIPEGYTYVNGQDLHTLWMDPGRGGRDREGNSCKKPYDHLNDKQRKMFTSLLALCFEYVDNCGE